MWFSSGALSSFGGLLIKRLLGQGPVSSLGASGVVLTLFATTALMNPEHQFGLIFLPNVVVEAEQLLNGIVMLDIVGLLFRFRVFDHAGHLAGVAIGVLYVKGGGFEVVETYRKMVVDGWCKYVRPIILGDGTKRSKS